MIVKIDNERYKSIPSFPDYGANQHGQIKRLAPRQGGRPIKPLTPSVFLLKGRPARTTVKIYRKEVHRGRSTTTGVARMVLEAWIGPPPGAGYHAAHKNGDAADNHLENLYWATPKQNSNDRHKHGTMIVGEACYNSKLTKTEVRQMRRDRLNGHTWDALSKRYSVSVHTVRSACNRVSWKHVS